MLMTAGTLIFWLFLFTLLAAIGIAAYQYRRTDKSQKRNGDDPYALEHKLQRQQAAVEAERRGDRA
jgi:hypothetical protein